MRQSLIKGNNNARRKGKACPHCAAAKPQKPMTKRNSRLSLALILVLIALTLPFTPGPALQHFFRASAQEPVAAPTPAVTVPAPNKAELRQALLDLSNPWTVMCVAAHPDDEDGTTLTVLRRKYGVNAVSLFSTYGEGGQNAVGPELYEELGVIRARETMKASEIQGSQPYFLGLKDFGFSKSAEEAFKVWGHDEALRRLVLKIRELRPDVIITNHDTSRGHGHHQATGQLIVEAFDAAADAKRFPEQLVQLKPWQAQRLFVRIFGAGGPDKSAGSGKIVSINPNEVDQRNGTSFAQQALLALQQHASQGPWPKSIEEWLRARGIEGGKLPPVRYQLVREAAGLQPLPEAPLTFLDGMKPSAPVAALIPAAIDNRPLTEFLDQPNQLLDALIKWRLAQSSAKPPSEVAPEDAHRFRLLETRTGKALALASGFSMAITPAGAALVPGTRTSFTINLANSGDRTLQISRLSFESLKEKVPVDPPDLLLADTETGLALELAVPKTAALTVPKEDHLYDGSVFGESLVADAELQIDGANFRLATQRNLDVVPQIEIKKVVPSPCVRTEEALGQCRAFDLTFTNHFRAPFRGAIKIGSANISKSPAGEITRQLVMGPNETRTETVRISNPIPDREALEELRKSETVIISIHRPDSITPITQRSVEVIYTDARVTPDLVVGYVPSFDQTLEQSLAALGVEATVLTVDAIKNADLSTYSIIIIDNRGYEAHPELVGANSRLLEYVQQGGNLIVFYHKDNEWNPDTNKNRPQLAVYPIVLGSDRVTDETAPIKFLQPRHLLLNYPNRITQVDFGNWIQERGLYYPKEWDPHYSALFSMNDKGEPPLRGGLLVARYGKGNYIYTSMVWYRQLRAGVPGAYRMLANMISYGQAPQRSLQPRKRKPRQRAKQPTPAP